MKDQITIGFKKLRDNDLAAFAYDVKKGMKGNPTFTDAPAALGKLETVLPEYQDTTSNARKGGKEMQLIRKAKRVEVIALLSELHEYVTLTCNGDGAKLVSSGFELAKARGTKVMAVIKELKVTIDRTGEAVTEVKRVAGAKAYVHQYTTDPLTSDNVWVSKGTTDPSYNFNGLKSKEKYWFQVIAVGLNGQESASPPVARVIQ